MEQPADHNPFLTPGDATRGQVEKLVNIPWQTRAAPPSAFENRLGDALERIFGRGVEALAEVVAALNAEGVRDRDGAPWSEASFQAEMKRLGA